MYQGARSVASNISKVIVMDSFKCCESASSSEISEKHETEDTRPKSAEIISVLPSLTVQKILSFLTWKDRLTAANTIPYWDHHLQSSVAWMCFHMDDTFDCISDDDETDAPELAKETECARLCIVRYGKFIQHCTIQLFCLHKNKAPDYGLMEAIARHCVHLKTFRINHRDKMFFAGEKQITRYVKCLKEIVTSCVGLRYFAVCNLGFHLCSRFRTSRDLRDVLRALDSKLSENINELEIYGFSHFNILYSLEKGSFRNLTKLHCEVEVLNEEVLTRMKHLRVLFLTRYKSNNSGFFTEPLAVCWSEVAEANPKLEVHYVFGLVIEPQLIHSNPLAHSLVVSNRCSQFARSKQLSNAIVNCYGKTLRQFVQLCPCNRNNINQFEEAKFYATVASKCRNLNTFLSSCTITAATVLLIAASRRIKNLWVEKEQIQFSSFPANMAKKISRASNLGDLKCDEWWDASVASLDSLQEQVSKFLGFPWRPLDPEEMSGKILTLTQ